MRGFWFKPHSRIKDSQEPENVQTVQLFQQLAVKPLIFDIKMCFKRFFSVKLYVCEENIPCWWIGSLFIGILPIVLEYS